VPAWKSESDFTKWYCQRLERVNTLILPMVAGAMSVAGVPDRYICHRKFRGWLEIKSDIGKTGTSGRVSKIQWNMMRQLEARGENVFIGRILKDSFFEIYSVGGAVVLGSGNECDLVAGDARGAQAAAARGEGRGMSAGADVTASGGTGIVCVGEMRGGAVRGGLGSATDSSGRGVDGSIVLDRIEMKIWAGRADHQKQAAGVEFIQMLARCVARRRKMLLGTQRDGSVVGSVADGVAGRGNGGTADRGEGLGGRGIGREGEWGAGGQSRRAGIGNNAINNIVAE